MVTRLVSEISSLDAFCDGGAAAVAAAGIGDSRSWMIMNIPIHVYTYRYTNIPTY